MNVTQSVVSERDRALLGGDYDAYHAQAVRRILTLRRRLGNTTPRGRKFAPKAPVTADNVAQNAEWVQLLLASSERAWARAMAMKTAQSPENTQKQMAGSTKKQIVSRYRRAILYATNLVEVLQDTQTSKATSTDVLEAKAYLALLRGGLYFEKTNWKQCIEQYAIAHFVYTALSAESKADVFKDLQSATVDPSIRYAAYQLKFPRTKTVQDVAVENFPSSEAELKRSIQEVRPDAFAATSEKPSTQSEQPSTLPQSLSWRSRNVKIEDAAISQALGKAQDKEANLHSTFGSFRQSQISSKDLATAFDDIIEAYQDAVDVTKNAIDELRAEGVDQGDSRVQSLQITRTAVSYAVIEWRIGRNRVLCGLDDGLSFDAEQSKQSSKPRKDGQSRTLKDESSGRKLARLRERVALYEAILRSVDAVNELPGVIADSAFTEELDGKRAYFRALKCLSIGRSHALDGNVTNALALFARAQELSQQAASTIKSSEPGSEEVSKLDVSSSQLRSLQSTVSSLVVQYRALAELKKVTGDKSSSSTKASAQPLIERFHLNQYDDNLDLGNLVNFPPKLQPVPVKPLFFDVAWNYIRYPGQGGAADAPLAKAPAAAAAPEPEAKPAKKGWFGFGR